MSIRPFAPNYCLRAFLLQTSSSDDAVSRLLVQVHFLSTMVLKIVFPFLILSSLCWAQGDYQPLAEAREAEEMLTGEEELLKEDLPRSRWKRNAESATTTESSSSASSLSCSVGMIIGPVLAVIALVDIGILVFVLYRRRALKICGKGGVDLAVNEESPYALPDAPTTAAPPPATPALATAATAVTSPGQSIPLQILNPRPVAGQSRSSPTGLEADSVYHEIDDSARKRQNQGALPASTAHAPDKTQSSYSNVPADQQKEGSPRAGTGNKDEPYYTPVIPDTYEKLADVRRDDGGYTSIATSKGLKAGGAPPSHQQGHKDPYYLHAV